MGKDQEIEYATIIISSEKELSGFLHDDIINLMIIDDSGLEKNIADNIGYQKLFVYSREKMDEFSKIPGSTSRTGRDYLNKMTHNTEKRDDAFVLVNTKNQKSLFYNKYLSGEITQVVIRDDSDKEIFDLTAGDFEVLQVDNDG